MQRQLQVRAYSIIAGWFLLLFLIAALLVSCAPKPTAKAFELGVKPKVNRVYPATFYSDKK